MSDAETPLFRAPKRRKTSTAPKLSHRPGHQSESDPESDNEQSTDLVKSRIQVKNRQRPSGMQFSNASVRQSNADGHNHESTALVPVTEAGENKANAHGLDNRFVVSGMGVGRDVVENDPNITAYVDAEMARRRQAQIMSSTQSSPHRMPQSTQANDTKDIDQDTTSEHATNSSLQPKSNASADASIKPSQPSKSIPLPLTNQPAEIDLSTHPLAAPSSTASAQKRKPPKLRLGRDGKPYRPRPRRGPNEEDIARGALVEQVLSEHDVRLASIQGQGQGGKVNGESGNRGKDEDADERMEREFRAQFLERSSVTSGAGSGGASGKSGGVGDGKKDGASAAGGGILSSGPRLGGSRSARARMVAALEKEREKEKEGLGK